MKLSEYQKSRSFFDLGQRSLRFQRKMFDFWPIYSGERFRASGPSCFFSMNKALKFCLQSTIGNNDLIFVLVSF